MHQMILPMLSIMKCSSSYATYKYTLWDCISLSTMKQKYTSLTTRKDVHIFTVSVTQVFVLSKMLVYFCECPNFIKSEISISFSALLTILNPSLQNTPQLKLRKVYDFATETFPLVVHYNLLSLSDFLKTESLFLSGCFFLPKL